MVGAEVGVIWAQKGGVGKTMLTAALGEYWAIECDGEDPITLLDADGQMSLTDWCGAEAPEAESMLAVLNGTRQIHEVMRPVGDSGRLFIAPGHPGLFDWRYTESGVDALRRALSDMRGRVLIDCGPAYLEVTKTALATGSWMLAPSQPGITDILSAQRMLNSLLSFQRQKINPGLVFAGFVLTLFRSVCSQDRRVQEYIHSDAFPFPACDTVISLAAAVKEATDRRQTIMTYAPTHKVADEIRALARELETA